MAEGPSGILTLVASTMNGEVVAFEVGGGGANGGANGREATRGKRIGEGGVGVTVILDGAREEGAAIKAKEVVVVGRDAELTFEVYDGREILGQRRRRRALEVGEDAPVPPSRSYEITVRETPYADTTATTPLYAGIVTGTGLHKITFSAVSMGQRTAAVEVYAQDAEDGRGGGDVVTMGFNTKFENMVGELLVLLPCLLLGVGIVLVEINKYT